MTPLKLRKIGVLYVPKPQNNKQLMFIFKKSLNIAKIAENQNLATDTLLRWNSLNPTLILASHSAGFLNSLKFNHGKYSPKNFTYFFVLAEAIRY